MVWYVCPNPRKPRIGLIRSSAWAFLPAHILLASVDALLSVKCCVLLGGIGRARSRRDSVQRAPRDTGRSSFARCGFPLGTDSRSDALRLPVTSNNSIDPL